MERRSLIERYRRAAEQAAFAPWARHWTPDRLLRLARNVTVTPEWVDDDRWWYRRETAAGHSFVLVDPDQGSLRAAFDHARVAELLGEAMGPPVDAERLPFDRLEFGDEAGDAAGDAAGTEVVRFEVEGNTWRCDVHAGTCEPDAVRLKPRFRPSSPDGDIPGLMTGDEVPSPDRSRIVSVRDHNLFLRNDGTGEERQLTLDGAPRHGYGQLSGTMWSGEVSWPRTGNPWPAQVLWSPDSRRFATVRVDNRKVRDLHLLDVRPEGRYDRRPVLHSYPVVLPGDDAIATVSIVVFDAWSGDRTEASLEPLPAFYPPIQAGHVWWSADGASVFVGRLERGKEAITLYRIDPRTGAASAVVTEAGAAFLDPTLYSEGGYAREARGGREILWVSERDGWRHVFRYDSRTGEPLGRITSGPWAVDRIVRVDDTEGHAYFTARGREPGRDPYYRHLYRVRLDGLGLALLTPEDADHDVEVAPSGRYFVDRASRVDLPAVTNLRTRDGTLVMEVERADVGELEAAGWRAPERFRASAADGETGVYGVLYRPSEFDATASYPVTDFVYGGPQLIVAPITFAQGLAGYFMAAASAEVGFVTVNIDGRGTPGRSRAFYDGGEGFMDGSGLVDHIAAVRHLALERPYLDLARVGITGFSGGGYTSTRAVLKYPDFYSVAVSGAGSHNQWVLGARWGEQYLGMPDAEPERWELQSNTALAANLQGKLLLVQGGLDDDVNPVNSYQVADALIRAGKAFDFQIVPALNHGWLAGDAYYWRLTWDYFAKHLLGEEPPDWNRVSFEAEVLGGGVG